MAELSCSREQLRYVTLRREAARNACTRGDYATAMQVTMPLASKGNAMAQANLGGLYEIGLGVPQGVTAATPGSLANQD